MQQHHDHPFLTILSELLDIPSPPGFEFRMGRHIAARLKKLGLTPHIDPIGNVSVRFEGSDPDAPLMMLASHIDEIAMLITRIEPDGTLRVGPTGSPRLEKLGEGPLDILSIDGEILATGVIGFGSGHIATKNQLDAFSWEHARVITGLSPQQLADRGVRVGLPALPTRSRRGPILLGDPANPLVAAWTFDDRAGVVTLLRLIDWMHETGAQPTHPTIIAFTVQEEGFCLGAKTIAARERPEIFIAVDGSPMPPRTSLVMDGRPCAWSKDQIATSDPRLVEQFTQAAKKAGTQLQTTIYETAWSDASQVLNIGAAPRVVTFGHIRENSHGFEVAPLRGFDNVLHTLQAFLRQRC